MILIVRRLSFQCVGIVVAAVLGSCTEPTYPLEAPMADLWISGPADLEGSWSIQEEVLKAELRVVPAEGDSIEVRYAPCVLRYRGYSDPELQHVSWSDARIPDEAGVTMSCNDIQLIGNATAESPLVISESVRGTELVHGLPAIGSFLTVVVDRDGTLVEIPAAHRIVGGGD